MKISVHHYHHFDGDDEMLAKLDKLAETLRKIEMTEAEILQSLADAKTVLTKVSGEIETVKANSAALQEAVTALEDQLANVGQPSPELQAAVAAVRAMADTLDAQLPDAVEPPAEG
jgi:septal ring factor EnvC (AmiA/AmiB activator)